MPILHSIEVKQDVEARVNALREKLPYQYLRAIMVFCPKLPKQKVYDLMTGRSIDVKLLKKIEEVVL